LVSMGPSKSFKFIGCTFLKLVIFILMKFTISTIHPSPSSRIKKRPS
jgi:hypothetical protein